MIRRAVVALDASQASAGLVETAAAVLAGRPWAKALLLHVREESSSEAVAQALVVRAARSLAARGLDVYPEVRIAGAAHRGEAIAAAIEEFGGDLLIIGSRGRDDLAGAVLGSVSHDALHRVDVPVLLVRGAPGATRVAAVCAGGAALAAVASASEAPAIAKALADLAPRAEACVVHVLEQVRPLRPPELDGDLDDVVSAALKSFKAVGVEADGEAVMSVQTVSETIEQVAAEQGADLLVVGSRRLSDMGGLVLGSVTHRLLHASDRPLLVAGRRARVRAFDPLQAPVLLGLSPSRS